MTSLWERLDQAAGRPALSAREIGAAAVRIADADGLDAITMRRLAAELGAAPMAAYRHVSGKEEVLELMVDLHPGGAVKRPADSLGTAVDEFVIYLGDNELHGRP